MNNSIIALNANGSILSTTNDYKYVQISPNITTSPPSNPNTNNNSNATVALPLDQNQLLQITQLMNEMQASANQNLNDSLTLTESNIIVQQPAQQQQQQNQQVYTNLMEFVMSSPTHQNQPQAQPQTPNQQTQNNTNNNIIFSPNSIIKLEQQIQFPTAQPIQQQIIIPQQQSDNTQVHTIMLNGQPALFIPASSALSSNLLCELLMNNNVATLGANGSGNNGQTFELSNQPIQLHLPMQLPIHMQQGDNNNSGNQQFVILNANGTFSSPIKLGNELGGNAGSSGDKLATNESSNSVNSTKPVSGKKKNAKKDAAGSNGLNSNASSNSNSQTGMELEDIFNENAEKKKRKACDCPNCYR